MESLEESGGIIDEEGNLFGVVNIVDALVVVLVLGVVVAGIALVVGGGSTTPAAVDTASTHVTLDLGIQPDYLVDEINEGDTYSPGANANLTVTEVYLTPQDGQTRVILRAELRGISADGGFSYAGAPPRIGRQLDISTDRYSVSGHIRAVGDSDALSRDTTTVVVEDSLSPAQASEVAAGDEIRLSGRTVATVQDVAVYATANTMRHTVVVEADLDTYTQQGVPRFGGAPVRRGQNVMLATEDYTVDGEIQRVGGGLDRGSLVNRTVTLEMTDVSEDTAAAIQPGMSETTAGDTIATVTNVTSVPSPIITTAQNGSVVVSDHPYRRDVTITAELRVRETTSGAQFKGEQIQQGSTVYLDLGSIGISARVVGLGG
jgi:hypothetical protein